MLQWRWKIASATTKSLHSQINKWITFLKIKIVWQPYDKLAPNISNHSAENPLCFRMFQSVQSLSCVRLFATPWTAAHQSSLSIISSWSLLKLMSIESVMPSSHLIVCRPLLFLPSIFPSSRVFSKESVLHIRWPKYCSFSFSICPSNEYSGLISFRIDWFDLFSPRDSQGSSPIPQLKSINSSAFSFLYGPTLISIHDYWKGWQKLHDIRESALELWKLMLVSDIFNVYSIGILECLYRYIFIVSQFFKGITLQK